MLEKNQNSNFEEPKKNHSNDDSDIIFHYCSPETFFNIIKNQEIWACDLEKVNDKGEGIRGKDIIEGIIDDIYLNNAQKPDIEIDENIIHCNVSFSKQGDSLDQWRFYGEDASGFSIGFSKKHLHMSNDDHFLNQCNNFENIKQLKQLKQLDKDLEYWQDIGEFFKHYRENLQLESHEENYRFSINDVIYDEEDFKEYINKNLQVVKSLSKGYDKQTPSLGNLHNRLKEDDFKKYRYLYKNPAYKNEEEVRLHIATHRISRYKEGRRKGDFGFMESIGRSILKFRNARGKISGYIPLNIIYYEIFDTYKPESIKDLKTTRAMVRKYIDQEKLPYVSIKGKLYPSLMRTFFHSIKKVYLGPKCSSSKIDTETFLNIYGFHDVEVISSTHDHYR